MAGRALLLIDPFPSAKYLSESFKALGIQTTAVYTAADLGTLQPYLRPRPEYFDEQIMAGSREVDDILAAVGSRSFDYVVNGYEGVVDVADRIALSLTPQLCNDPATSGTRMDKLLMHEAVAGQGLPHIRQQRILPNEAGIDDDQLADLRWPCFIKPSRGAGSKGVAKLNNRAELDSYLTNIEPAELLVNDDGAMTFLLGEFVEGREYFVDTFSRNGIHFISSIQRYCKLLVDGSPMYRYAELETSQELADVLSEYVRGVLSSVGMANGFAHTEVFVRDDGTPVLIEVNPRASGAMGLPNRLVTFEGRMSQPELLSAVLFENYRETTYVPPDCTHGRLLCLFHFSDQPLPDLVPVLERFTSVESVHQMAPTGHVHKEPPRSLLECVAMVVCRSDDPQRMVEESDEILQQDLVGW